MSGRRFVVTGRVQGVGYRRYVETTAYDLNIYGEVWNRNDGAVEIEAWSDDATFLDTFERRLLTGPGHPEHVSSMPVHEPADRFTAMTAVRR